MAETTSGTDPLKNQTPAATAALTPVQTVLYLCVSILILAMYLIMNANIYPGYPVITDYAEQSRAYSAHYPPFRMNEWLTYTITDEVITGDASLPESLAANHPIGYSLIATPLTRTFGEIGMYYTNAVILWVCALLFFHLAYMAAGFNMALLMTMVLAFATPNLFFAASAYGEPLSQLLLLAGTVAWFAARRHPARQNLFDVLCGCACGLQLFVIPMLTLTVGVPLIAAVRSGENVGDRLKWLGAGFLGALTIFGLVSAIVLHRVPLDIFTFNAYLNIFNIESMYYSGQNPIISILKLLFDSPHGILFVMPVTMLTPLGLLTMWRCGRRALSFGILAVIIVVLGISALCQCPISGEVIGTRQHAPLIPFFLLPLVFFRYLGRGEQSWLAVAMVLTVYQCSFGWWLGTARGEGAFVGILNDRAGRYILLARKDMLGRPHFQSTNDIRNEFRQSLEKHDIRRWLTTLDQHTIREIEGFERFIFTRLIEQTENDADNIDTYIASIDPDTGIRMVMPDLLAPQPAFPNGFPAD